jgi:hypothetical protein
MVYRQAARGKMCAKMTRRARWLLTTVLVLVLGVVMSACSTPAQSVPSGEATAVEGSGVPQGTGTAPEASDTSPQPGVSPGATEEPQVGTTGETNCTGTNPHPVGQSIADTYDVSYEQVMTWFCDGYGFGEITLALETAKVATDYTAGDLLASKGQGKGWGKVWQELGLIGNAKDAGPPPHAKNDKDKGKDKNKGKNKGKSGNKGKGSKPGDDEQDDEEKSGVSCPDGRELSEDERDEVEDLAEEYDVANAEVLTMFCEGMSFKEIETQLEGE